MNLVQSNKRRSESKITEENKAIVKEWVETTCPKVTPSPNQRDTRLTRDQGGTVVGQERVVLYEKSKGELYFEFIKPPNGGGCPIARDEDGLIVIGRTTFEKLLPKNLKRMNQTHKRNCACREHLNTEWKHQALKRNRDARLMDLKNTVRIQELAHREAGVVRAKELEKNFREFAYTETGDSKWPTMNSAYLLMTCQSVGEEVLAI